MHKRTVALEEIVMKESSLVKGSAASAAAASKNNKDFTIKESAKSKKEAFVPDFDEDELPDLI